MLREQDRGLDDRVGFSDEHVEFSGGLWSTGRYENCKEGTLGSYAPASTVRMRQSARVSKALQSALLAAMVSSKAVLHGASGDAAANAATAAKARSTAASEAMRSRGVVKKRVKEESLSQLKGESDWWIYWL